MAAKDVGKCMGVTVEGYDYSEHQFGKDIKDDIICPMNGFFLRRSGTKATKLSLLKTCIKLSSLNQGNYCSCVYNENSQDLNVKHV